MFSRIRTITQVSDHTAQKLTFTNMKRENSLLTERIVFIQRSVYFSVRVNLQMIFCGAVKFPASRSSTEVLVNPAASTSISPLPRVTRLAPGTRRPWGPGQPRSQRFLQTRIQGAQ